MYDTSGYPATFRVTRSARKHLVGVARMRAAMRDAGEPVVVGDQRIYIGTDGRGVELEIVAVPDDSGRAEWAVIHAMPTAWREG